MLRGTWSNMGSNPHPLTSEQFHEARERHRHISARLSAFTESAAEYRCSNPDCETCGKAYDGTGVVTMEDSAIGWKCDVCAKKGGSDG